GIRAHQSLGCAGQTVRPSFHSISQTSAGKLLLLKLVGLCFPSLMSEGDDSRLIGATARENRPSDAGELVGELHPQHVAGEPPRSNATNSASLHSAAAPAQRVRPARTVSANTCCRAWRSCPGSCDLRSTPASVRDPARHRSRVPA